MIAVILFKIIITIIVTSIGRAKVCSTYVAADLYAKSLSWLRLRVACLYLFALRNITLDGYLDTRRNI